MFAVFQSFLVQQIKKYSIITDAPTANNLEDRQNEIDDAFHEIQKVMEYELHIKISGEKIQFRNVEKSSLLIKLL